MIDVISRIFGTFVVLALGYLAKKNGLVKPKHSKLMGALFFNITLPFSIANAFLSVEFPPELMSLPFISLSVMVVLLLTSFIISRKMSLDQKKMLIICLPSYGFGSFTLPFLQNIYGAIAVIIVVIYDVGNAVLSTGGTYAAAAIATSGEKVPLKDNVRSVAMTLVKSPPLMTAIVMFIIMSTGINIPKDLLSNLVSPVANANGFVAIFMIGIIIDFNMDKSVFKSAFGVVAIKMITNIIIAFTLYILLPFSQDVRQMLFIMSLSPVGQLSVVFIERLKGNMAEVAFINTLSILTSFLIMAVAVLFFAAS